VPILTCPKCAAGLRIPDGAIGAARCPRCKTLIPIEGGVVNRTNEAPALPPPPPPGAAATIQDFPAPRSDGIPNLALDLALPHPPPPPPKLVPPPKPVITAKTVSPPKPPTAPAPALKPPAPKPVPPPPKRPAFEVVGETMEPLPLDDLPPLPPVRGRADAPRRDDDYDDEYDDRPRRESDGRGAAKVGTLLVSISLWIYLGIYGVVSFIVLLAVMQAGLSALDVLGTIAGIVGFGNWTVALVGIGFLIAGPAKYGLRGLSIATAVVGGIHFILVILCAFGVTGGRSRGGLGFADELHGDLKAAATLVPLLDFFPTLLYVASKTQGLGELFSHLIIPLLAAMCEVARFILLMLVMKAAARIGKDSGAASKAQVSVVIYSAVNGVIPILILLIAVIMGETRSSGRGGGGGEGMLTVAKILAVLIALAHTCALIMPGVAANDARAACARRARSRRGD
jgi:hypothetical protein